MKKRWGFMGIVIVGVALLGLWLEGGYTPACASCSAKEQPFFHILSSLTLDQEARIKKFTSLANQTYLHFRVAVSPEEAIYPDVKQIMDRCPERFVKLPHGFHPQEMMYRWLHSIPPTDIVVLFPPEGAFEAAALDRLKSFYIDSAAWVGFQGDVKKWARGGVLTGYANLFQEIKLQEFLDHGTFSEEKTPENRLFELAGRHVRRLRGCFIEGKNYGHSFLARNIQSRKPYPRYRPGQESPAPQTDLVIFSYNRPLQLYALLESVEWHVKHLDRISVIYRVEGSDYEKGYEIVKQRFPQVDYLKQGDNPKGDFKPLVLKASFQSPNPYILFAVDDIIVTDTIDLQKGIEHMEKVGAWGVYYRLGRHTNFSYIQNRSLKIPPSFQLEKDVYAWQFSSGEGEWKFPNTVDMTLYRKDDIKELFKALPYTEPYSLENKWDLKRKTSGVGIYYEQAKMINIPLNIVNFSPYPHSHRHTAEELLSKLLEGLKLDIKSLQGYRSPSAHVDVPVSFVKRDET